MSTREKIGDSPKRREDDRFVRGRAEYLDDRKFPNAAHAVVLRSPHPHARILGIDAAAASALPGVLAVLTSAEIARDGLGPLPPTATANVTTGEPFRFQSQPLLAVDRVRYVGEPVALIVAESLARALDAAERVNVSYEPLPPLTTMSAARAAGAVQISAEVPGNVCLDWRLGDRSAVEAAIKSAAHVVSLHIENHRIVTNPMEPRGAVGIYDPVQARYTLYASTQNVHVNRDHAARALGVPVQAVRFVAAELGGGFGAKNFAYAEQVLMLWAARIVGRPVKWIATRSEGFLSDHQARDHVAEASLALDSDGRFLALSVDGMANAGAYLKSTGATQTLQYVNLPGTAYRIPAIALHVAVVLTTTTPVGVTRGPGYAEANNIIERLIDRAAAEFGFDRIELRRKNLVPSTQMPMVNALGYSVDSGRFPETFELALQKADVTGFAARRSASAAKGKLRGLGVVYHMKGNAGFPSENVDIRFEADGSVSLIAGTHNHGQGHETTFPQILADRLGIPNDLIHLRQGDSDLIAMGGASASSRSTYMAGTAIHLASQEIIEKARRFASGMLEAAESDIQFDDGRLVVVGTDRSVGLLDVAAKARAAGSPLDTYRFWTREFMTFPNGAHIVEVEVDRATGRVHLDRYTAVDDYGVLVNPMIATGQVHGAIAQGVGQALTEQAAVDAATGQPLTGSFMDYAMPRADDLPSYDVSFNVIPCTTNPLGVKGAGESGAIAAFPAIANAVDDALASIGGAPLGGMPTSERVWRAIQKAALAG